MSDPEGPYVIEHGDVWHLNSGPRLPGADGIGLPDRRHVCGPSENLAIAFDEEDGTLHKHGTETRVRAWIDGFREKMAAVPSEHALPIPVMMTFPPNAETVAEMNRCIATTGRIKRLHDGLLSDADRLPSP